MIPFWLTPVITVSGIFIFWGIIIWLVNKEAKQLKKK